MHDLVYLRLSVSVMAFILFVSAEVLPEARQDSLLTVARDESRPVKDRLSSFAGLVVHYGESDPVKALRLGKEGLALFEGGRPNVERARLYMNMAFVHFSCREYEPAIACFEEAARIYEETGRVRAEEIRPQNNRKVLSGWLWGEIPAGMLLVFFPFYLYKNRKKRLCREHLRSNALEMDLLRQKIEDYDSLLPHEFTIKRDDVNFFLKKVLSSRELDVFMLLLKGFSNHKIAEQLFVSVNTVKFHLQNIYVKLDVKNRAEAVLCVSKG